MDQTNQIQSIAKCIFSSLDKMKFNSFDSPPIHSKISKLTKNRLNYVIQSINFANVYLKDLKKNITINNCLQNSMKRVRKNNRGKEQNVKQNPFSKTAKIPSSSTEPHQNQEQVFLAQNLEIKIQKLSKSQIKLTCKEIQLAQNSTKPNTHYFPHRLKFLKKKNKLGLTLKAPQNSFKQNDGLNINRASNGQFYSSHRNIFSPTVSITKRPSSGIPPKKSKIRRQKSAFSGKEQKNINFEQKIINLSKSMKSKQQFVKNIFRSKARSSKDETKSFFKISGIELQQKSPNIIPWEFEEQQKTRYMLDFDSEIRYRR